MHRGHGYNLEINKDLNVRIIILFYFSFFSSLAFGLSGLEIVKKADKMRILEFDNSFIAEVNDFRGSDIQKTKYKVFSKGVQMSRVETIFPERQAGRKLLMKEQDLWFFTPDLKRPTRVSMQQRLTGEVANGDLARTSFGDDYNVEVKGEEVVDGVKAVRLSLKKKKSEVTYAAVEYWVGLSSYAPLKAIFKSDSGKDLKVATYKDPKKYFGQTLMTKIEIVSSLNKKQRSVLTFSGFKKEQLNESFFNKESLNN